VSRGGRWYVNKPLGYFIAVLLCPINVLTSICPKAEEHFTTIYVSDVFSRLKISKVSK
jgi:hypothetical protein